MKDISDRIQEIPLSPIRKLTPLADEAKSRGIKVYHLNIGQPDIHTPEEGMDAMRKIDRKVLEYSPSQGFLSLRQRISEYYADFGMKYSPDEIIVTTGASEAVLFSFITCMDPGDEIITTEPTYANYLSFAAAAGVKVVPITTSIDNGFALPPAERFEELITDRTRAILICNPNNPSGSLYSREEMEMLAEIVKRHGIFLFADEVYREFVYDGMDFFSAGHLEGVDENVVIFDSMSKRFSECGIRIGAVITKNKAVAEGFLKLAQARLSPPLIGQIVAEASFSAGHAYLDPIAKEYRHRRNVLVECLQNIPGIKVIRPQGAFYVIASLPVENAEDFCSWCLSDFSDNGETVMMAPASGFYITPGLGLSEVRIAYVLNAADLQRATAILGKALQQYNSTRC
ncbi:MAG: pyridoxal phosphate-dependent aminotransferase [Bacteroidetes bacterium]|uniref:Pyridoxal phosphate-dependent aminotransferase n=1 Tax=Candidatus Cryptobacteroides faecigallinarum TaxID=2840763 RepID=A0A9D9ILP4_9BACT|nr:pyridoxal phosphate-dependent aminotransferase [Candidatus Cryptobacteroides faecigallinarum]